MELVFCLLVVQIQPQVLFIFLDKVFSSFSTMLHFGNDTANNSQRWSCHNHVLIPQELIGKAYV